MATAQRSVRHIKKPARFEESPSPPSSRKQRTDKNEASDEEYFPGTIIMAKNIKGKLYFLIAWSGYDTTAWTWEPSSCLDRAGLMLQSFLHHEPFVSLDDKIFFCCRLQVYSISPHVFHSLFQERIMKVLKKNSSGRIRAGALSIEPIEESSFLVFNSIFRPIGDISKHSTNILYLEKDQFPEHLFRNEWDQYFIRFPLRSSNLICFPVLAQATVFAFRCKPIWYARRV